LPAGATGESIIRWNWEFDNGAKFIFPSPSLVLPAGTQHAKLTIETNFGCKSVLADSMFTINAKPQIKLDISDSCVYRSIKYNATDLNNSTGNWYWDFGNGLYRDAATISKSYPTKGPRPFRLIAESTKGCKDTLIRPFVIYDNKANAGRDTIVAKGEPVQLNANGDDDATYIWTPATGLNNGSLENPVAILDRDQLYQLDVYTKEGCDSHSQIFIKRYKGPELYIPNAFTPNADGKNDILVGAPLDTYQTTVSGLLGNVNVNVKAGKVYYYRSEDLLSASNPSPFLQIRLQGDNFFGIGILGLLNNTDVNALFGYSIGVSDDLNGDNRQDIIIGCPAYLGKNLLSIQSGAAFVYYSNNLGTTSPVQLAVPTPSIGRNANMRSNVISTPLRGSGAYDKSRRPITPIW